MPRPWELPAEPEWPSALDSGAVFGVPRGVTGGQHDDRLDLLVDDLLWQHPTLFEGWNDYGICVVWRLEDPEVSVRYEPAHRLVTISAGHVGSRGSTVRQVRSLLYLGMLEAVQWKQRRRRTVVAEPVLAAGKPANLQRSLF